MLPYMPIQKLIQSIPVNKGVMRGIYQHFCDKQTSYDL